MGASTLTLSFDPQGVFHSISETLSCPLPGVSEVLPNLQPGLALRQVLAWDCDGSLTYSPEPLTPTDAGGASQIPASLCWPHSTIPWILL